MKKFLCFSILFFVGILFAPHVQAGDCKTRDKVDWHATISSATNVRIDCDDHKGPVGSSVGVVPAGEVIRILEVDRYQENYLVETTVGTGFVFRSFLKDIVQSPLLRPEPSVFRDLAKDHPYYDAIADVKARGIVQGTPDGKINVDNKVNRVELAKILVEATWDDDHIAQASLSSNVYSDVEKGAWYLPYLELARQKGFMGGDAQNANVTTTIRPGDFANGAEVAKMIAIAFDLDVRLGAEDEEWYEPYMGVLQKKGAMPYSSPTHLVTRGEMMFMISVVLKK